MAVILAVVLLMLSWAIHLLQEAMTRREFSFWLAGVLVAVASAATVYVYLMIHNCLSQLNQLHPGF